jgi:hypothetical protein
LYLQTNKEINCVDDIEKETRNNKEKNEFTRKELLVVID